MSNHSALESLHEKGLSYRTLAIVTGIHIKDVKEARHEPAILSLQSKERCKRLNEMLTEAMNANSELDPVAIFESHILLGKVGLKKKWAYLSNLWVNNCITDAFLLNALCNTTKLYSYDVLRKNHPLEYEVVEGGDGFKGILAKLPIDEASGEDFRRFHL